MLGRRLMNKYLTDWLESFFLAGSGETMREYSFLNSYLDFLGVFFLFFGLLRHLVVPLLLLDLFSDNHFLDWLRFSRC